jgi:hypothetical protein
MASLAATKPIIAAILMEEGSRRRTVDPCSLPLILLCPPVLCTAPSSIKKIKIQARREYTSRRMNQQSAGWQVKPTGWELVEMSLVS